MLISCYAMDVTTILARHVWVGESTFTAFTRQEASVHLHAMWVVRCHAKLVVRSNAMGANLAKAVGHVMDTAKHAFCHANYANRATNGHAKYASRATLLAIQAAKSLANQDVKQAAKTANQDAKSHAKIANQDAKSHAKLVAKYLAKHVTRHVIQAATTASNAMVAIQAATTAKDAICTTNR